jgi:hypothetical protein
MMLGVSCPYISTEHSGGVTLNPINPSKLPIVLSFFLFMCPLIKRTEDVLHACVYPCVTVLQLTEELKRSLEVLFRVGYVALTLFHRLPQVGARNTKFSNGGDV